ncbi:MAG: SURF1 family protein [Pseudomonadota bacterium]
MGTRRFQPEWRTTMLVVLLLPCLIWLGFWQLTRAEEKARLAAEFELKQSRAPLSLLELDDRSPEALAYLPVRMRGRFRPQEYFLLDNRTQDGRYGNEVIGVFDLAGSDEVVLVNRGWVPADPARLELPEVPPVADEVRLLGRVYVPPGEPYLLGDQVMATGWPKRVQAVQIETLRDALGDVRLFPYSVRLDPETPGALVTRWPIVNVSPDKHQGYAVQWFAMAAVLLLLYVWRSFHDTNPPERHEGQMQ